MTLKIVEVAPMPSANDKTATMVKPGLLASMRTANFRSASTAPMIPSPRPEPGDDPGGKGMPFASRRKRRIVGESTSLQ